MLARQGQTDEYAIADKADAAQSLGKMPPDWTGRRQARSVFLVREGLETVRLGRPPPS
jgi:hypothetical protein